MEISSSITAIVTGGASGLGEAVVRDLAAAGAKVTIFDLNKERGEAVAKELGAVYCDVDVSSDASVEAGFAKSRAAHGQERVLVNCAGIASGNKIVTRNKQTGELVPHPMKLFDKTIQINLLGTFRCAAIAATGMAAADPLNPDGERGVIINTASVAAQDGQIGQCAYSASKGGVVAMTLPMARDLMSEGVRVNTILPGLMHTPMMAGLPQNVQDALSASVPFPKRLGTPAEFAHLVHTIVTNSYLNGECIRLDGALRMAPR